MKTLRNPLRLLLLLLELLLLPALVRAQYTTAYYFDDSLVITGYTGPGGTVIIPSSINGFPVISIGANAFRGKSSLTNVTIPNSISSIGAGAFSGCSSLTGVIFNGQAPVADATAFSGTNNLTIYYYLGNNGWGASFAGVPTQAFDPFTTTTNGDGSLTISGYTGPGGALFIPNAFNGVAVSSIGAGAFNGNSSVVSVTIPTSVTSIGANAFAKTGLVSALIPTSVTTIGASAFLNCFYLTNITLPSTLTTVGSNIFSNCPNLLGVTIIGNAPNATVYSAMFTGANRQLMIYYLPGTTGWGSTSIGFRSEPLFNYTSTNSSIIITGFLGYGGDVTIPDTINGLPVTMIGATAFNNCAFLTGITIPNSVTSIGNEAFAGCENLTAVSFGTGVTSIGNEAFYSCFHNALASANSNHFTSLTFPNSVTSIGVAAFLDCYDLPGITLGANVVSLGAAAFENCQGLTGIIFPISLTNIGEFAFDGTGLTSVTIPSSLISIGSMAFSFCADLAAINVSAGNPAYSSFGGVLFDQNQQTLIQYPDGNTAATYIIPVGVTSIGASAFGSNYLSSITIPISVTSVGDNAFSASSLTAINVTAGNPDYSSANGVLFDAGQNMLIRYPAGLIGATYSIPGSVASIGAYAFAGCDNLSLVTIPNGVSFIGSDAFFGCSSLTAITIPPSMTNIGVNVFHGCSSLFNVSISNNVTSLSSDAFEACANLTGVFVFGNAPAADSTVFAGDNNVTIYYLPGTSGWGSTFAGVTTVMMAPPTLTTSSASSTVVAGANATFTVAASATPAPTYEWQVSTNGGLTWTNLSDGPTYSGSTTGTLTVTNPSTTLLGYQYQAVLTNFAGTTATTPVPLIVGTSTAKLSWLQSNFTTAQLGEPSVVGDFATPANDGIPNLLKYAFNLPALTNGQGLLPQPMMGNGQGTLTFQALQSDLTYTVQASTDLVNWSTTGVTTQTNGSQVTASCSLAGNPAVFMEVVVAPAP